MEGGLSPSSPRLAPRGRPMSGVVIRKQIWVDFPRQRSGGTTPRDVRSVDWGVASDRRNTDGDPGAAT